MRNTIINVKEYFKENGGSPFIVGLMLLSIGAAVSLSVRLSSQVDTTAVYSFSALIGGVVLQTLCYIKYPLRDNGAAV